MDANLFNQLKELLTVINNSDNLYDQLTTKGVSFNVQALTAWVKLTQEKTK